MQYRWWHFVQLPLDGWWWFKRRKKRLSYERLTLLHHCILWWRYCTIVSSTNVLPPHCSSVAHIFAPHMFIVVVVVIVVLFYFSTWTWIVVILKSTDRNFIWLHWWFALCLKSCLSETRQPSLSGCFKWCFWLSCWQQLGKHTAFKYLAPSMGHGCSLSLSFLGTSTALLVCCLRWMSYIDDVAAIQSGFVLSEISKSGLPDLYPLRLGER